jgi:hypothetical protein
MENILFIFILVGILTILLAWGFRYLPDEKWQILAVTPRQKMGSDTWYGLNLTFYGLFNALAYSFGAGMLILLLASAEMPVAAWLPLIVGILGICVPASKIIARIVEKKPSTFTVAGASFVGMLITPVLVCMINQTIGHHMGFSVSLVPVMAALGIAYAFGEGIGRLACISFGCCYGRPISQFPPRIQRLVSRFCFVFSGKTKKIAYAHGLDGQKVLPVQAVTSIIFCTGGLLGVGLFLYGYETAAFLSVVGITQVWRLISEVFRADYRGGGKVSAYQRLAAVSVVLAMAIAFFAPETRSVEVHIADGLRALWNPLVILFLQSAAVGIFLYTGRSRVTGANLTFFVIHDRI